MVWAWVVSTPLGLPVVPEVNIRSLTSPGLTAFEISSKTLCGILLPGPRNCRRARIGGVPLSLKTVFVKLAFVPVPPTFLNNSTVVPSGAIR